jgi:hypothetical protein
LLISAWSIEEESLKRSPWLSPPGIAVIRLLAALQETAES